MAYNPNIIVAERVIETVRVQKGLSPLKTIKYRQGFEDIKEKFNFYWQI